MSGITRNKIPDKLPASDGLIQSELALLLYQRTHLSANVVPTEPRNVSIEVREEAINAWVERGYAAAYRKLTAEHDKLVNPKSETELAGLLAETEAILH